MKSQQKEDNPISMTCDGCKFAQRAGNIQVGCEAGRIKKFKKAGDVDLKFSFPTSYGLKRFCNLYRDQEWLDKQETKDSPLHIARKEIEPTFGIVIYDRNVTGRNLKKTAESIKNIDYDKKKIFVVINYIPHPDKKDSDVEKHVAITNDLNSHGVKTALVLNKWDEPRLVDYNAFSRCVSASHLVKMDSLSEMPKDMLRRVDLSLNEDMEKIIVFRHKSISCVSFPTVNDEYLNHNDFDKMIMSIESAAKQVNMIKNV